MHGFLLPDGKGKKRKAILMTFLDDSTRRILYANFSFTERSIEFEAGIKNILKAHGKIKMLSVDYPEVLEMPKFPEKPRVRVQFHGFREKTSA